MLHLREPYMQSITKSTLTAMLAEAGITIEATIFSSQTLIVSKY